MGESKRKQQVYYNQVRTLLETCNKPTLEYPTDEYSGILNTYIPVVCKAYRDWKQVTNRIVQFKLKLVEKWIVSFDKLTEDGDAINIETKLIEIDFPSYFRDNLRKLLRQEAYIKNIPENEVEEYIRGNTIYFSLTQYCLEKLFELPDATEATVSQAIYFPETNTYDAGYPIPFEKSVALRKEDFNNLQKVSPKFKNFFKESDFEFN